MNDQFSAPRGSLTSGRLEFARGAAGLAIRGASMADLFQARFRGPVPAVSVHGGAVTVRYPRFSPRGWLRPWRRLRQPAAVLKQQPQRKRRRNLMSSCKRSAATRSM